MSKRRHQLNPAKVKADIAALNNASAPAGRRGRAGLRRRWTVLLLCLLSSAALLASFAPFDCWPLAYVALAPWALAVAAGTERRWALLCGYLAGLLFWAVGVYWLTWITMAGFVPLVLYLGVYWLVAAWFIRRAFERRWPMWLALPLVWVALEYARAFVLSGLPWFYLAHSQYGCLRLIQIVDVTGQYGVSFFVAMVNGAVVDVLAPLLAGGGKVAPLRRRVGRPAAACLLAAATMMTYGAVRLRQDTLSPGPRVGVVQMAFPVSLTSEGASSQETFDAYALNSAALTPGACDLVVWPESMLGFGNMDPSYWKEFDPDARDPADRSRFVYDEEDREIIRTYQGNLARLGELIGRLGCPLLAGGGSPARHAAEGERLSCNSALLYDRGPDGWPRLLYRYDKMHLVPFGEYVPFRKSWPALHRALRWFVPEQMPQIEPGRAAVRFEIASGGRAVRFVAPICYEGVFDRVCRDLVGKDSTRPAELLVNISNDGWFVYQGRRFVVAGEQVVVASTELPQHLVQYVFRAIENRVPVVRAVNTGISAHIDPNGRILQTVSHDGRRGMVAGNFVAQTLVDRRVSIYSRIGDLFVIAVSVAALMAAALLLRRVGKSKEGKR